MSEGEPFKAMVSVEAPACAAAIDRRCARGGRGPRAAASPRAAARRMSGAATQLWIQSFLNWLDASSALPRPLIWAAMIIPPIRRALSVNLDGGS